MKASISEIYSLLKRELNKNDAKDLISDTIHNAISDAEEIGADIDSNVEKSLNDLKEMLLKKDKAA
ncbi:hypothetical protein HBN50_07740 [Halobacteriovorax sp. GB3]|uniref:hypothetical protein n=1 Tax=Halobacteriovorax sp. GB3 TaxID=2719615 RepID=UPI002362F715|nr:hypothetical protein [Halobacteriovorax sp. GB3]MDD0852983.1 hypothetical protein [Halobacteriovorax sp. GB3]